jgi:hypothetical protein
MFDLFNVNLCNVWFMVMKVTFVAVWTRQLESRIRDNKNEYPIGSFREIGKAPEQLFQPIVDIMGSTERKLNQVKTALVDEERIDPNLSFAFRLVVYPTFYFKFLSILVYHCINWLEIDLILLRA